MAPDEKARDSEDKLRLDEVLRAAQAALGSDNDDLSSVVLAATNSMPADASEFDRGLAAGIALARYLDMVARKSHIDD